MVRFAETRVYPSFGFFTGRPVPDYGVGTAPRGGLIDYANVPPIIGMIVSAGRATLSELQNEYGLEDAYNIAEIILVDSHNHDKAKATKAK
jgi:hypothetical protein